MTGVDDALVDGNFVFGCGYEGISFPLGGGVRCKVTNNTVMGCATQFTAAQDAYAIVVEQDDASVSDNYAPVVNNAPAGGKYVAGLLANGHRMTITGNNVVGVGGGGATQAGMVLGANANACIATGNHFNGRGVTDLGAANLCDLLVANQP